MNDDLQLENSSQKAVSSAFSLLDVRQLKGNQIVLDGVNLEIEAGKITALVGPSGAGKTSLLRLLNRLDDPASGQIFYHSRPITEYPVQNLRLQVGFVFQTPVMFPGTVADNLRTALELAGKSIVDSDNLIAETLRLAEIDVSLFERDGTQLSVGQKQRVNIARALMTAPEVLLMDEPTSALDPETADKLMETVRHLGREKKITVVMVTHRLSEAKRASDTTIVMEAGRVLETGATDFIFGQTTNPRIREFLSIGK
ncbi:MAG: ATP-binding cassette domain-containing protein [Pyrinomonadaceae bacterium]